MINIRRGSHAYLLLRLLAVTGEIPMKIVRMLGSERSWKVLIYKMNTVQKVRITDTDERFECRLLTIGGKGRLKTIRLHKAALPILVKIDPWAYDYYMESFGCHHFSGDERHIDRNHRVAEVMVTCMRAGVLVYQPGHPDILSEKMQNLDPARPYFYVGRDLKKLEVSELNKTKFTRVVGLMVSPGECRAVYNCRDKPMEWLGRGERKARIHLSDILMPCTSHMIDTAVLFGLDINIAYQTLEKAYKSRKYEACLHGIYSHIHFIPFDEFGIRLLRIITLRDWKNQLLDMLFYPSTRIREIDYGIEMDAYDGKKWWYSHLDGDIGRLIRLKEKLENATSMIVDMVCYPYQKDMLTKFLGDRIRVHLINMEDVERHLGLIEDDDDDEEDEDD